jgi:hypothetical protein
MFIKKELLSDYPKIAKLSCKAENGEKKQQRVLIYTKTKKYEWRLLIIRIDPQEVVFVWE